MNILYLEDDPIDAKFATMTFRALGIETFTVSKDFESLSELLLVNDYDFVLTDMKLGMDEFMEHYHRFLGIPYIMISNSPRELDLGHRPKGIFSKPISKDKAEAMLDLVKSSEPEVPNHEYLFGITEGDADLLKEMAALIEVQFRQANEGLPKLYEEGNNKEVISIIHKMVGKFSVIGMPSSSVLFSGAEQTLKSDIELPRYQFNLMLEKTSKAITYLSSLTAG